MERRNILKLLLIFLILFMIVLSFLFLKNLKKEGNIITESNGDFLYSEPAVLYGAGYPSELVEEDFDEFDDDLSGGGGGGRDDECIVNSDCGTDHSGENYCVGDRVYRKEYSYSCDGQCSENIKRELVKRCYLGCEDGECTDSFPFDCSLDYECGVDDFVNYPVCNDNDAYQDYVDWTCNEPGASSSYCSVELKFKLVEQCNVGLSCNIGVCM